MASSGIVKWISLVVAAAVLGACSAPGPREGFAETDALEPMSRVFLNGNRRLDFYVLKPAAEGYDLVTPSLFQHMIGNGLSHLELPADFANYLLQGDFDASLNTFARFAINTVVGAGGLLDPAGEAGIPREGTDFGITLGTYGVGEGTYLVLPLIGPTTARDVTGFVVDRAFSPTFYIGQFTSLDAVGPGITGLGFVDTRNRNGDLIDSVLYEAEDSYVTLRAAYLQRRRALVAGDDAADNLPDIFDDEGAPSQ
ncbi:MAG: VacJ family lipoprotein [Pseudomonadota bacterium]